MQIPFLPKNKYVTLALFIALFLFYKFYLKDFTKEFDSQQWKAVTNDEYKHREQLLNDLFALHDLIGKSQDDIIELLGEPIPNIYSTNNQMYYPTKIIRNNKEQVVFATGLFLQLNGNKIVISYDLREWKKY